MDGRESGISDGSAPTRELSSLDLHLPAYDLDTGITTHLPAQTRLFFSVPTSALSAVPTSWWGSHAPSGAAILMTEWTGASWTTPIVVVTPVQLALVTADDIDALAVQRDMSTFRVVFSTTAAPANLQVMYKDMLAEGEVPPAPVTGAGGVGLVPDAGAGNGNIDAICMWDPTAAQCSPSVIWSYVFGSPTRVGGAPAFPTSFVPRTLEASVLRSCEPGAATLQCQMSGWTAAGAVSGLALHLITAGDRDRPFGEWHLHAMFARNPTAEFGDPKVSPVIIPASLLAPATGRCLNLWSVWIGVNDPAMPPFAQSHMVRISL